MPCSMQNKAPVQIKGKVHNYLSWIIRPNHAVERVAKNAPLTAALKV
jgi:hypothetical protein